MGQIQVQKGLGYFLHHAFPPLLRPKDLCEEARGSACSSSTPPAKSCSLHSRIDCRTSGHDGCVCCLAAVIGAGRVLLVQVSIHLLQKEECAAINYIGSWVQLAPGACHPTCETGGPMASHEGELDGMDAGRSVACCWLREIRHLLG